LERSIGVFYCKLAFFSQIVKYRLSTILISYYSNKLGTKTHLRTSVSVKMESLPAFFRTPEAHFILTHQQ